MRTRTNIAIGAVMLLFTVIGVLCLFADMFYEIDDLGGPRGSGYYNLFMIKEMGYDNFIVPLIVAWCLECAAFLAVIVGLFFSGKSQGIIFGVSGLFLIAGAVLFFCTVPLYSAALGSQLTEPNGGYYTLTLGAAPICNGIFCGLAGLLGCYVAYSSFKAN